MRIANQSHLSVDPALERLVLDALQHAQIEEGDGRFDTVTASYYIRPSRPDVPWWLDLGSELLATLVGQELDAPVVPLVMTTGPSGDPLLVGPHRAFATLSEVPHVEPVNREDLNLLATVEELVMNQDDRLDHFHVYQEGDVGHAVEAVNHGFTFHVNHPATTSATDVAAWTEVARSVTTRDYHYEVELWNDVVPGIGAVEALSDDDIRGIVDEVCSDLDRTARAAIDAEPPQELPLHNTTWSETLRIRRDNIRWIMAERFPGISPLRAH